MANLKISVLPAGAAPSLPDLLVSVQGGTTVKISVAQLFALLGSNQRYAYTNGAPSLTWTIIHGLGGYPVVTVVDNIGAVVEGDVTYLDPNTVQIVFPTPQDGKAFFYLASPNYVHDQLVAALVWTIPHNLYRFPSVTVVDSFDNVVLADVAYVDDQIVTVTFASPFSGRAFLN